LQGRRPRKRPSVPCEHHRPRSSRSVTGNVAGGARQSAAADSVGPGRSSQLPLPDRRRKVTETARFLPRVAIEPFDTGRYHRSALSCGTDRLENFLRFAARRQQKEGFTRMFVAVARGLARILCCRALDARRLRHASPERTMPARAVFVSSVRGARQKFAGSPSAEDMSPGWGPRIGGSCRSAAPMSPERPRRAATWRWCSSNVPCTRI